MDRRLGLDANEARSLEALESTGVSSTLRRRMEQEAEDKKIKKTNQGSLSRRVAKSVRLRKSTRIAANSLMNSLQRGSQRLTRLSRAAHELQKATTDPSNPAASPLVSRYGYVDLPDESLIKDDGTYDITIIEDVLRFGDEREEAHELLKGPKEYYRVYPGKVAFLVRMLSLTSTDDITFVSGSLFVHCAQKKSSWSGKTQVEADPETRSFRKLRIYDNKTFPALVQDFKSPACYLAEQDSRGSVRFDSFLEEIPYENTIVVNRVSLGIARVADKLWSLYEADGMFPLDDFWKTPKESKTMQFAHRIAQFLTQLLMLPRAFPIAHLGGLPDLKLDRYSPIIPTAIKMDPTEKLRLDAYEICELIPRPELEELLLVECSFDGVEVRRQTSGSTLLLCSPLFAYYVRGGGPVFPNPNGNFALATSVIFNTPCVDRTGTIVDPEVRMAPTDRIPNVFIGRRTRRVAGGISASERSALYDQLLGSSEDVQTEILDQSGIPDLMQRTADAAVNRAIQLGVRTIQVLLTADISSLGMLMALIDLGPERFYSNHLLIRVVSIETVLPAEYADLESLWSTSHEWIPIIEMQISEDGEIGEILDMRDSLVLSSTHADLIFGSPLYTSFYRKHDTRAVCGADLGPTQLDEGWQAAMRNHIRERQVMSPSNIEPLMSLFRHQADLAPFEIRSMRDFLWWVSFTMLWNGASVNLVSRIDSMNEDRSRHIFDFYRSSEWQKWSLDEANHKYLKFPRGRMGYKLKNYMKILNVYVRGIARLVAQDEAWLDKFDSINNGLRGGLIPVLSSSSSSSSIHLANEGGVGDVAATLDDAFSSSLAFGPSSAFAVTSALEVIRFGPRSLMLDDLELAYGGSLTCYLRDDN